MCFGNFNCEKAKERKDTFLKDWQECKESYVLLPQKAGQWCTSLCNPLTLRVGGLLVYSPKSTARVKRCHCNVTLDKGLFTRLSRESPVFTMKVTKFWSLTKMNSINRHMNMKVDSALTQPPSQKSVRAHTLTAGLQRIQLNYTPTADPRAL